MLSSCEGRGAVDDGLLVLCYSHSIPINSEERSLHLSVCSSGSYHSHDASMMGEEEASARMSTPRRASGEPAAGTTLGRTAAADRRGVAPSPPGTQHSSPSPPTSTRPRVVEVPSSPLRTKEAFPALRRDGSRSRCWMSRNNTKGPLRELRHLHVNTNATSRSPSCEDASTLTNTPSVPHFLSFSRVESILQRIRRETSRSNYVRSSRSSSSMKQNVGQRRAAEDGFDDDDDDDDEANGVCSPFTPTPMCLMLPTFVSRGDLDAASTHTSSNTNTNTKSSRDDGNAVVVRATHYHRQLSQEQLLPSLHVGVLEPSQSQEKMRSDVYAWRGCAADEDAMARPTSPSAEWQPTTVLDAWLRVGSAESAVSLQSIPYNSSEDAEDEEDQGEMLMHDELQGLMVEVRTPSPPTMASSIQQMHNSPILFSQTTRHVGEGALPPSAHERRYGTRTQRQALGSFSFVSSSSNSSPMSVLSSWA